jgi:ABC-type transport system involved in multi-copper enzyme maturation permease subunit
MILMALSATVGASMIARDVRHHALVMYFSRSITRLDYLVGKFLALVLFLLLVTLGPGVLLWSGQIGMSQEKLSWAQRLGDLLAITLHSLILTVPMSAVVLAFSSLTKRTYVAAILWAAFFFSSLTFSTILEGVLKSSWPKLLSWANLTAHLGDLCYPGRGPSTPVLDCGWGPPFAILLGLTTLSLAVVWRRLRSTEGAE